MSGDVVEWTGAACSEGQRTPCGPDASRYGWYCGHYEHMHDRSRFGRCEPGARWMPWSFRRAPRKRGPNRCRRTRVLQGRT